MADVGTRFAFEPTWVAGICLQKSKKPIRFRVIGFLFVIRHLWPTL
jgi:hypothetical protein